MKLAEFTAKLRRGRVTFEEEGPELVERAEASGQVLADALARVLAETAEIYSGWQMGELRHDWSGGEETWWLIADNWLVKAKPALRPRGGERRIADVAIRLLPLAMAHPIVTFSYIHVLDERGPRELIYGANIRLVVEGETLEVGGDARDAAGALHFIHHLNEAAKRAARQRPQQES